MKVKIVKVGYLETNCYVLEKEDKCLIIDPGYDSEKIINNISKEVAGILITHHHFDHVGALDDLLENYHTKMYDMSNLTEGINNINDFEFEVVFTPGHSADSISFLFKNDLFCGDFIFEGTIGRTDLETGNMSVMKESIKKILTYNKEITIYPGHGEPTTLEKETISLKSFLD